MIQTTPMVIITTFLLSSPLDAGAVFAPSIRKSNLRRGLLTTECENIVHALHEYSEFCGCALDDGGATYSIACLGCEECSDGYQQKICGLPTRSYTVSSQDDWTVENRVVCVEYTQGPHEGGTLCYDIGGDTCEVRWNQDDGCTSCYPKECDSKGFMALDCTNYDDGDIWDFCSLSAVTIDPSSRFAVLTENVFQWSTPRECSSDKAADLEVTPTPTWALLLGGALIVAFICGGGTTYVVRQDACGNFYVVR
mmetsp:Transcript_5803/g.9643  ORF Transcript_5803/g.9643 Transcript_5803/m.9643 type:complete len:252 (+) Transcript_5803:244-999(+)|eukprot:CAMPEP_0119026706 /NCGR_PEP_ID=MMETSP1176-20130426/35924_1 /TAXON_ID=265551 /ORGANISM="Synedropsis recta cf, Strain CCMP1620" /LENGTH=251 /DNA_ID=CAMNT_0006982477 /DNA_START=228 /DNA_END=983 /DNA_ORIENTATION=+